MARKQKTGPLRKIVEVIAYGTSIFDSDRVKLECGHTTYSTGQYQARCSKCAAASAQLT